MTLIVVTGPQEQWIGVAHRGGASACVGKPWRRALLPGIQWETSQRISENAIELRQRLKAHVERNLTYAQIDIVQKCARLFDSAAVTLLNSSRK